MKSSFALVPQSATVSLSRAGFATARPLPDTPVRRALGSVVPIVAAVLLLLAGPAAPASAKPRPKRDSAPAKVETPAPKIEASGDEPPAEVRVERVRPARSKVETLRFLKENRDFIRARFDRLRARVLPRKAASQEIDPRFLAYRDLRTESIAAADSLALLRAARERQTLLSSVSDLGALEVRLDRLERLLAQQHERLGVLEADFTGEQRTELIVVVAGMPQDGALERIDLVFEHGETITAALDEQQRQALARGGVLEIFHGLVEPRAQIVELSIDGIGLPAESGFLTLAPERDRLTFLKLDLTPLGKGHGTASVRATSWRDGAAVAGGD